MIINMLKGFEEDDGPLPLIISTTDNVYAPCFITCEDETHLSIVINVEEEDEQKMYH